MGGVFYPQARVVLQIVFDNFGPTAQATDPQIIPVLPKEVTVHRNSYRQADSWEVTFEGNDLPVDPQMVLSAAAEVFLFRLTEREQEIRLLSRQHTVLMDTSDEKPRDEFDAQMLELGMTKAKDKFTFGNMPMVAGLVDDVSLEMSSNGKWLHMSGQDYTAYLMARQWPPTAKGTPRRIPVGKRLDVWLQDILDEADPQHRLKVKLENIDEASLPTVGSAETRDKARGIPVEQDTSYWDVIYKVVKRYGAVCFVRGLDVILTRPTSIRDEFEHRIRRLAWGCNVENLELTRHLGKEKVPRIIARGYDPKTQKTVTAEFPPAPAKTTVSTKVKGKNLTRDKVVRRKSAIPEGHLGVEQDEYQVVPVYGVSDPARLLEIAKNMFTVLGQAERRVRVTTRDLVDFEGNSMLDLNPGDPITIGFVDFNQEMIANPDVPMAKKYAHLMARGYNEQVAAIIAEHYQQLEFLKRPMRVREMSFDYSAENGITVEIEAVDFVVIDGQRDTSTKEKRSAKRADKTTAAKDTFNADGSPKLK